MGGRVFRVALCGLLVVAAGCGKRGAKKSPCPRATGIEKLTSAIDISAQGPFDLKSFTVAKSLWGEDGFRLEIFIANQDYAPARMAGLASPVKENGHGFVALTLHNGGDAIAAGEYRYGRHKQTFSSLVEIGVKGRMVSPGFSEGVVRVLEIEDGRVCGDFAFRGRESVLEGAFVAPLSER